MIRPSFVALLLSGALLTPLPLAAQTADADGDPTFIDPTFIDPTFIEGASDHADELHKEALELGRQGRHEEARTKLLEAFALKSSYDIAANLGHAELKLGRYKDAAEHLAHSLREAPSGRKTLRAKVEQALAEAKRELATVRLRVAPEGARVLIDGRPVEPRLLAHELYLEPGLHRFVAEHGDEPPAEVDRRLDRGSASTIELAVGLAGEGSDAGGGEHPMPWLLGTGYGAGLAAGIAAAVLGGVAASKLGSARELGDELTTELGEAPCGTDPRCERVGDLYDQHRRLASSAVWLGVGAVVLLGATLGYQLLSGNSDGGTATLLPWVLPTGAGGLVASIEW